MLGDFLMFDVPVLSTVSKITPSYEIKACLTLNRLQLLQSRISYVMPGKHFRNPLYFKSKVNAVRFLGPKLILGKQEIYKCTFLDKIFCQKVMELLRGKKTVRYWDAFRLYFG